MKIPETFKKSFLIVKITIAVLPIAWILYRIDYLKLLSAYRDSAWWILPSTIMINLFVMFLQSFRWWILIKGFVPDLAFYKAFSAHMRGVYYSLILPSTASQDIIRAGYLSKDIKYDIAWSSTWVSRLTGVCILLLFSLFGLMIIDKKSLPVNTIESVAIMFTLFSLLILLSFSKKTTRLLRPAIVRIIPEKLLKIIEELRGSVYKYKYKKRLMIELIILTLLIQVVTIFNNAIIFKGITGNFFFLECLVFIPIIKLVCLSLPITPAGVGIREALFFVMFKHLGLSEEALGIFLIMIYAGLLTKLFGGITILIEKHIKKKI